MKRSVSSILAFAQTFALLLTFSAVSAEASSVVSELRVSQRSTMAYASTQSVEVDGRPVEFQMYALKDANGYDTNYVKLRDVAYVLNGTAAQFDVEWNRVVKVWPGWGYTANGSEMYTPYQGDRPYTQPGGVTLVDGEDRYLDAILLNDDNGGGYTYYKLRDLGNALGFTVDWSSERGVYIETQLAQNGEELPEGLEDETPEDGEEGRGEDWDALVPFEDNAYIVLELDAVTSWADAYAYCDEQEGHLVTVDSQAENDHVRTLLAQADVDVAFLGLTKENGEWVWYNGLPMIYDNWANGQPGGGNYAVIDSSGQWSTRTSFGSAAFICEWDN